MGDHSGMQSRNMFDALLTQPKGRDSKEKAAPKHEAKEAKKKAERAAAAAATASPPASAREPTARTGTKRGVSNAKGTRPASAGRGKGETADSRGKRFQDRKSQADFQKNHGGAAKGGLGFGGVQDIAQEARDAAEVHNATGATDVTAAAADAAADKAAEKTEDKKEPEKPDPTVSFRQYEADLAKKAPEGDIKEARKPIVGKEFKAGAVAPKKKGVQESFMKIDKEALEPKEKKTEEKKEKKEKKTKEKDGGKAAKAPKPAKKVLSLDAFSGPRNDGRVPIPADAPRPRRDEAAPAAAATAAAAATPAAGAAATPAAGAAAAPAAGATAAAPAAGAAPAAAAATTGGAGRPASAGGRGAGRGAGGGRGQGPRGAGRGRGGPRGAAIDFASAFPPLAAAAAATAAPAK